MNEKNLKIKEIIENKDKIIDFDVDEYYSKHKDNILGYDVDEYRSRESIYECENLKHVISMINITPNGDYNIYYECSIFNGDDFEKMDVSLLGHNYLYVGNVEHLNWINETIWYSDYPEKWLIEHNNKYYLYIGPIDDHCKIVEVADIKIW